MKKPDRLTVSLVTDMPNHNHLFRQYSCMWQVRIHKSNDELATTIIGVVSLESTLFVLYHLMAKNPASCTVILRQLLLYLISTFAYYLGLSMHHQSWMRPIAQKLLRIPSITRILYGQMTIVL